MTSTELKILKQVKEKHSHMGDHRILLCTKVARNDNTHINYTLPVQARTEGHEPRNSLGNQYILLPFHL